MLRYTRCNSDIDGCNCVADVVHQFLWGGGGGRNFLSGHLKGKVYESNPHTIQELKDISHAAAAIKITMLHRLYLNMVTARLSTVQTL